MHDLCLLCVIVKRDQDEQLPAFFQAQGLNTITTLLCEGTAGKKLLDLLGLEKTEKELYYAMTTRPRARRLMNTMIHELGLEIPGHGVAFTIPMGSIGGASSLDYFTCGQNILLGEVTEMPHAFLYELIIAIANRGHVDSVMDAARSAGAMGGTVLHAKGTGMELAKKFFGVSLASEKEMVLILAREADKRPIMKAVMSEAGIQSPAQSIVFSFPVGEVSGLRLLAD